jgi:hypothetical protein
MNELLAYVLSYVGVLLLSFFVANLLTKGLFLKYVRAMMGKKKGKVLVMARTSVFDYDRVGVLIEGHLRYKDRGKNFRSLICPEDAPFSFLGIIVVQVDENRNAVMKRDYTPVSGFDAQKIDDLMLRALNRSRLNDLKSKVILILILVGLSILLGIGNMMMLSSLKKQIIPMLYNCDWHQLINTTTNTLPVVSGVAI